jgi:hypothetical protein
MRTAFRFFGFVTLAVLASLRVALAVDSFGVLPNTSTAQPACTAARERQTWVTSASVGVPTLEQLCICDTLAASCHWVSSISASTAGTANEIAFFSGTQSLDGTPALTRDASDNLNLTVSTNLETGFAVTNFDPGINAAAYITAFDFDGARFDIWAASAAYTNQGAGTWANKVVLDARGDPPGVGGTLALLASYTAGEIELGVGSDNLTTARRMLISNNNEVIFTAREVYSPQVVALAVAGPTTVSVIRGVIDCTCTVVANCNVLLSEVLILDGTLVHIRTNAASTGNCRFANTAGQQLTQNGVAQLLDDNDHTSFLYSTPGSAWIQNTVVIAVP